MTKEFESTGDRYRIIEKENKLNEKFYFVQFGFHKIELWKRKYLIGKKYLYKEILYWKYIFKNEKKEWDSILIMNFFDGRNENYDLNEHLHQACKSIYEAKSLIEKHKSYLIVESEKNSENRKKEEEDKKQAELRKLTTYEKIIS